MTIRILLFGACREAACGTGEGEMRLELSAPATVESAWRLLRAQFPPLNHFAGNVLFAVNESYARRVDPLADGDTLAIFPPVSGG
jgi:molybdopterin converting factor small subunit